MKEGVGLSNFTYFLLGFVCAVVLYIGQHIIISMYESDANAKILEKFIKDDDSGKSNE